MDQQELKNKLKEIDSKLIRSEQKRDNRIYLYCEAANVYEVNKFLFEDVGARFVIATGMDCSSSIEIHYHYSYDQLGWVINVNVALEDRENPEVESITPFLPAAEWIEREMHDLLGINFKNHPNLKRLILTDEWPEGVYPLRKEVKK